MNYLEIVLRGYFDDNKRQFLEKYFYREYKKAEKEKFFEASEFFSGCLKATKGLKNEINQQINKYKTHLHTELKNAETLEKIDFYKQELEGIIKGSHSITMPLHSQTTGRTRQIGLNEINQINLAIAKAYAKTNDVNSLIPQPTSEQQTNFNGNTSFETFEQYLKHIDLVKESDPEKYDFINEVFNEVTDIDLSRFVERLALSFEKNKKAYSEISTKAGKEIFIKEQIELYTYATHRYKKYGRYANAALDKWKPVFIEILEYWKNEFKEKDTKEPEPTVNVENQFSNDFKALFNCQNFLIPKVAIEDVYNHFKILTETTNKFNEFYLTNEQLYFFIKSTFIDKKPERKKFNGIPKPKKNVRKVFYEFYVKCGKYETNQTSIKRKYFNIMNDAFEGFNENDYNDFHKT